MYWGWKSPQIPPRSLSFRRSQTNLTFPCCLQAEGVILPWKAFLHYWTHPENRYYRVGMVGWVTHGMAPQGPQTMSPPSLHPDWLSPWKIGFSGPAWQSCQQGSLHLPWWHDWVVSPPGDEFTPLLVGRSHGRADGALEKLLLTGLAQQVDGSPAFNQESGADHAVSVAYLRQLLRRRKKNTFLPSHF